MPASVKVNKTAVRRFLLEKQALNSQEHTKNVYIDDVLHMIQKLECVQIDPVAVVAQNQHLVLSARLPGYKPEELEHLLDYRQVFEYWANEACIIPMEDYPIFEVIRRRMSERLQPELDRLGSVVREVLDRLEREGPLPSKAFVSVKRVHGYWDNAEAKTKETSHVLNLLNTIGRIQVVRRERTTRFFDIRERAVPKELLDHAKRISDEESKTALLDKYMRAYRVIDVGDPHFGWQRMKVDERRQTANRLLEQGILVPIQVDGVKRTYFILAEDVDLLLQHAAGSREVASNRWNSVRFLPPLDNLLWRRDRIKDFFDFSYTWEIYTPASKRQFGYYAMPILVGDEIIGRIDPKLDRKRARLNIQLLQINPQVRWTKSLRLRVLDALEVFARSHGAELGHIERTIPDGLDI
jgi:uncharacterized protein YcaQ